jgi:hypothetical protein
VELFDLDFWEVGFDKINHFVEYTGIMALGLIPGPSPFYGEGCLD